MCNTSFDYLICEYMVYCRSRQLRAKTMNSYEQGLRLFERWCQEQMSIDDVSKYGILEFKSIFPKRQSFVRRSTMNKKGQRACFAYT